MTTTRVPNETNVVAGWDDAHRYTPAPRHRRRLIVDLVRDLGAREVLDAGCGQPFLLRELRDQLGLRCYGCDISDHTIEDPAWQGIAEELRVINLEQETWPDGRTFDLVVCSEVLEHIPDWRAALHNVVAMTGDHVLITVPGGKRRPMDAIVGHHRHFTIDMVASALREEGCEPIIGRRWGLPMHTLYRWAISRVGADRMYDSFGSEGYSRTQILLSHLLYGAFFVNDAFHGGDQIFVLARR